MTLLEWLRYAYYSFVKKETGPAINSSEFIDPVARSPHVDDLIEITTNIAKAPPAIIILTVVGNDGDLRERYFVADNVKRIPEAIVHIEMLTQELMGMIDPDEEYDEP